MKRLLLLGMLIVGLLPQAMAQKTVTGRVSSLAEGDYLPGVAVQVKGTNTGTVTDVDGNYRIAVPSDEAVLVFSFIGYERVEERVGTRSSIDVRLAEDIEKLSELVVIGYGSVKKSDLTGSVAQVKPDDLIKRPVASVDQLLQGQAPGLQVITASGEPGAGATIRIRGNSSLRGSNSPLLVVDGFPWGDAGNLKQINPEDIASIEILKDASASAIYGSRGANGVILITTRKGSKGQSSIRFSTMQTISTLAITPDVWSDPVDLAIIDNEARMNAGQEPLYTGQNYLGTYFPSVAELRNGSWPHRTYWPDLVYRNAHSQNYTLSADGGNEKTTYSISANYFNDQGLVIKNGYQRYNGRLNLTQQVHDKVTLGTNLIVTHTNRSGVGVGAGRNPIFPVYDEDGNYFRTGPNDFDHPLAQVNEILSVGKTIDVLATIDANWKITDWLTFRTQLSDQYGNANNDRYEPIGITFAGNEQNGVAQINNQTYNTLLNENYFTINKTFGNIHNLNLVAGYTTQRNRYRGVFLQASDFVNNNLKNENLNTGVNQITRNDGNDRLLNSWIGRASYSLRERYLLTLTGRADGSSVFGQNNKWGYFPSAAFAWKIHEEGFMNNLSSVSEAKLRLSYGSSGNQAIPPYRTLDQLGAGKYYTGSDFETGFGPGTYSWDGYLKVWQGLANPDLKWETTTQFNAGLDLGLFNNRLTLTADYYQKHTEDLLRLKRLPLSSGFDEIWVNDGVIDNRGIELGFNAELISRPDFQWGIGGNFTRNRNELISIGEVDTVRYEGDIEMIRGSVGRYIVGQPIGTFFGLRTDGIIQSLEEGLAAGLTGNMAQPGEIKYVDHNGDGVVDDRDRVVIGDPNPRFIFAFNSNMAYKKFDLAVQLYGIYGNDVFDFQKFSPSRQLQRWTVDNPTQEYPRVSSSRQWYSSDWFVRDGSFLRLQNVTLGYNLVPKAIKGIQSLRLYVSGNNLHTFTRFNPGFDPEVGANGQHWGSYPRPRAYSFGLNVTF